MNSKASVGKRLFQYALCAKGIFIAAIIALAIGVGAELAGPVHRQDDDRRSYAGY
ncbi:hypothetical protein ABIE48_001861 [Paenibacillus sp. OAE614]